MKKSVWHRIKSNPSKQNTDLMVSGFLIFRNFPWKSFSLLQLFLWWHIICQMFVTSSSTRRQNEKRINFALGEFTILRARNVNNRSEALCLINATNCCRLRISRLLSKIKQKKGKDYVERKRQINWVIAMCTNPWKIFCVLSTIDSRKPQSQHLAIAEHQIAVVPV